MFYKVFFIFNYFMGFDFLVFYCLVIYCLAFYCLATFDLYCCNGNAPLPSFITTSANCFSGDLL
jgi:hypothetical protein